MDSTLRLCLTLLLLSLSTLSYGNSLEASKTQLQSQLQELRQSQRELVIEQDNSVQRFIHAQEQLNTSLDERAQLIATLPVDQRAKVLGFGPQGVRSFQLELRVLWARAHSTPLLLKRGIYQFIQDIQLSPMPIISAIFQWLLGMGAFIYWLRAIVPSIADIAKGKNLDKDKRLSASLQTLCWWGIRIRRPLEWWLFLSFTLSVIGELLIFLNLSPLQVMVNWLLLGTAFILLIDTLGASRHRRRRRKDAQAKLRLRSIKWLGRVFIVTGLLLSLIDVLGISGGTVGAWIRVLFIWAVVPLLIIVLRWWRPVVMENITKPEHQGRPVAHWVAARPKGIISLLSTTVGGVYLLLIGLSKWLLSIASEREIVRSAMAHFFRVEIARQSAIEQQRNKLEHFDTTGISAFTNEHQTSHWLDEVMQAELDALSHSCNKERPTINVIYAGRGRGKTSFLKQLEQQQQAQRRCIYLACNKGASFADMLPALGTALEVEEPEIARNVVAAFKDCDKMTVLLDDVQRLITPTIGGLKELDRLVRFIRRASPNISWVLSIEAASWRFVERARGERFLFDLEQELPRWPEEQIARLLEERTAEAGLEVSYDGMELPRQLDTGEDEEEQTSKGYARIVWEYAKGNPGVALYLWSQSLFVDESGKTVVRLFEIPDTSELERLGVTLLLTLRAIVQLEAAHKDDIASATNLSSEEVVDALRLLVSKGYVDRDSDNFYSINWPWYRAVTTVLNRQHLLIL